MKTKKVRPHTKPCFIIGIFYTLFTVWCIFQLPDIYNLAADYAVIIGADGAGWIYASKERCLLVFGLASIWFVGGAVASLCAAVLKRGYRIAMWHFAITVLGMFMYRYLLS